MANSFTQRKGRQNDRFNHHQTEISLHTTSTRSSALPKLVHLADASCQLQCTLFSTTFNPQRQRLGNKVLRQRLKGPQLAAYYPRKTGTIADIQKEFAKFDLETWNDDEEDRLESLQIARLRGKGPPKKKRTADSKSRFRSWLTNLLTTISEWKEEKEEISDTIAIVALHVMIPSILQVVKRDHRKCISMIVYTIQKTHYTQNHASNCWERPDNQSTGANNNIPLITILRRHVTQNSQDSISSNYPCTGGPAQNTGR